jgi:hypothetical protein
VDKVSSRSEKSEIGIPVFQKWLVSNVVMGLPVGCLSTAVADVSATNKDG